MLHVLTLEDTGTAWPVFLLLLSVALGLAFARLQRMSSQAQLKNASACSWLHGHTVAMLVSIGSEADSEK